MPSFNETDLLAHIASAKNKEQVKESTVCGCFRCLSVFPASEVERFLSDGTAICPHCGVDAVLGEKSGFPITKEFLEHMKTVWFS